MSGRDVFVSAHVAAINVPAGLNSQRNTRSGFSSPCRETVLGSAPQILPVSRGSDIRLHLGATRVVRARGAAEATKSHGKHDERDGRQCL
jgi:hypothetical protein